MNRSIAIDGPCGAGKSTIAALAARRLGGHYLDTGAMYRAVGLFMLENGIDCADASAVAANVDRAVITLNYDMDNVQHTCLNGRDVSGLIRTPAVSMAASAVAQVKNVRLALVARQKQLAGEMFLVADGRDIGTHVITDAALKIFLTAAPEERARRRLAQNGGCFEQVLEDINKRDYNDTHREESPLAKAQDAVEIDTTCMTIEQVTEKIVGLYRERVAQ